MCKHSDAYLFGIILVIIWVLSGFLFTTFFPCHHIIQEARENQIERIEIQRSQVYSDITALREGPETNRVRDRMYSRIKYLENEQHQILNAIMECRYQ